MATPTSELPETPLGRCEFWPTVLLLPPSALARLDELVRRAQTVAATEPFGRGEMVGGLIMRCNITDPEGLVKLAQGRWSRNSLKTYARDDVLGNAARDRLYLRLPSPVSWRLARLVERAQRTGERVTRAGIVTGLVYIAPTGAGELREVVRDARTRLARDAALDGESPASVLSLGRPQPGPTPMRATQRPKRTRQRSGGAGPPPPRRASQRPPPRRPRSGEGVPS